MTDNDILFADTETDGLWKQGFGPLHPDQPRPVQIAFARHVPHGQEISANCILVSPNPDWRDLTQDSINIHGITEELRRTGMEPTMAGKLLELAMAAMTKPGHYIALAGHNIGFDIMVLVAFYLNIGRQDVADALLQTKTIDTMYMGIDVCRLPKKDNSYSPGYKRPSLTELYRFLFGEELDGAHDALIDVRASARCYYKMREMGVPDAPTVMPSTDGGRDRALLESVIERCNRAPLKSANEMDVVKKNSEKFHKYGEVFFCSDKVWNWLVQISNRVA